MRLDKTVFYHQFHDFASPAGCGYITSRNVGIGRRLVWTVFIVTGIFFSLYTSYMCAVRYFAYPSSIKPAFTAEDVLKFPKITLCANGMHSMQSIERHYPKLVGTDLTHVYSGLKEHDKRNQTLLKLLKSVEYDEFLAKSAAPFKLLGCRFMNDFCNEKWEWKMTRYGICKQFNPYGEQFKQSKSKDGKESKEKITQKISLSIVVGYNQTDTQYGWFNFLAGMTAYFSDPMEDTQDSTYSINMPPKVVPILSVRQLHTRKLGPPYSNCQREGGHKLKHFKNYTKAQCLFECKIVKINAKCGCLPGYMNDKSPNSTTTARVCSLYEHAECVVPILKSFTNDLCDCPEACSEHLPKGNYKNAETILKRSRSFFNSMSAAVVFIPDQSEVTHIETADYPSEQFLSDVGGAAGLVLGLSLTTILGMFDCVILSCISLLRHGLYVTFNRSSNYFTARRKHQKAVSAYTIARSEPTPRCVEWRIKTER